MIIGMNSIYSYNLIFAHKLENFQNNTCLPLLEVEWSLQSQRSAVCPETGESWNGVLKSVCVSETFAEPSLQATQLKLKRARLADDLNEKIAQRPGPMELVEKNILPVDSSVKEAIIGK